MAFPPAPRAVAEKEGFRAEKRLNTKKRAKEVEIKE